MQAFANIREQLDDLSQSSPVAVGLLKLTVSSCLMLNFLGGAWYELECPVFVLLSPMRFIKTITCASSTCGMK